jgi:NADPH:quinone reductase-like Zn-dependent oxidoreductase
MQINPVTVVGLLEVVAVPHGGWLLVTAAGSTLGKMLIAVAKHQGLKVIGTVRRPEQAAEIKALG